MTTKTKPEMINVPIQDIEALKLRLSMGAPLTEPETKILIAIVNVYQWMYGQLSAAKLTIHRLTKMFGFNTEKRNNASKAKDNNGQKNNTSKDDESVTEVATFEQEGEKEPQKKH